MFYSQYVLAKKATLGRVWLAAHWDKKLTKAQIFQTDIRKSVDSIINPEVPMALRMSGHLLLGVTRIYARKVKYLLAECNEALVKIKMAFKGGETTSTTELRPEEVVATYASITLPEAYGEMDITLPDISLEALPVPDDSELLNVNVARKMLITLNVTDIEDARADLPDTQGALDFGIATGPQGFDDDPLLNLGDDLEPERKRSEVMEAPMELDMETGGVTPGFETPGEPIGVATPIRTPIGQDIPAPTFQPTTPLEPGTPSTGLPTPVTAPAKKQQKKRKITIDASTFINSDAIRRQIDETEDVVRELAVAPPSKRLMMHRIKELKGSDFFLKNPIIEGLAPELRDIFSRTMTVQRPTIAPAQKEVEPFEEIEPTPLSPISAPIPADIDVDVDQGVPPSPIPSTPGGADYSAAATPTSVYKEEMIGEGLTERTKKMHKFLSNNFRERDELNYLQMIAGKNRKTVVGTFFELLVLKSRGIVDLRQDNPYGDIIIGKTDAFDQIKV